LNIFGVDIEILATRVSRAKKTCEKARSTIAGFCVILVSNLGSRKIVAARPQKSNNSFKSSLMQLTFCHTDHNFWLC
jgi:hypothetical protein